MNVACRPTGQHIALQATFSHPCLPCLACRPSSTSLAHWLRAIFEPRACTSPELSALLDVLPAELVVHIFALAAPQQRQCTSLHPHGHPDILPVLLPADPACQSKCLRCGTVHEP